MTKHGKMVWSYGVTTVPKRMDNLLLRTLDSLALAGFDKPRLFVDGVTNLHIDRDAYEVTFRDPPLKAYGNWIMAAWELYLRNPHADRYALFQDDFVTYKNLRHYLESCPYPDRGYQNLYTFPKNVNATKQGWYPTVGQDGKGAVALVFDNKTFCTLLHQSHMVSRVKGTRGTSAIDGAVVQAMHDVQPTGYQEFVHNPSLVQHTGKLSAIGNKPHAEADTFCGEQFDCCEWVK